MKEVKHFSGINKLGADRTHNLCPNVGKRLISGLPAGIHAVSLRIDLNPVTNRHGLLHQLPGRQIERLEQAYGVGEDRPVTGQLAEAGCRVFCA